MVNDMRISLIIPTLNAGSEIGGLLETVLSQTVVPDEILVIDSSSGDDTVAIASSFDGVRVEVIRRSDFDHGGTRHQALLETGGDIVCFLTQDAIPANDEYFENLIRVFVDPLLAMASGRQMPKPDARRFEQLVREFNYPAESNVRTIDDLSEYGIKTFFASDVCSAYRRSAYAEVGGFNRPCNTNEDMFMAAKLIRAGYKVAYVADAEVLHSHNLTLCEQYKRNKEIGISLAENSELLLNASDTSEGIRLVESVSMQLLKEGKIFEFGRFGLDCAARLLGNRNGRKAGGRTSL